MVLQRGAKSSLARKGKAKSRRKVVNKTIVRNGRVKPTMAGVKYFQCALNPFMGGVGAKIPDGATLLTIPMDFKGTYSITPVSGDATGTIGFYMYPALPGAVMLMQGTATITNVVGASVTVSATCLTGGIPVPFILNFPDNATPSGLGVFPDFNTRSITRGRTVAWGMEVRPIGPLLSTQGQAAMARIPVSWRQGFPMRGSATMPYGGAVVWKQAPIVKYGSFKIPTFNEISSYPDSKVCPVAETCCILGRQGEGQHEFQSVEAEYLDFYSDSAGLVANNTILALNTLTTTGQTFSAGPPVVNPGAHGQAFTANYAMFGMIPQRTGDNTVMGHYWLPSGHEMLAYAATGVATSYSIEVVARLCVEVEVDQTSAFRTMSTPCAPRDDRALDVVADIQKRMPVSVSKPEPSGNWWTTMANVIGGVGGTLADFDIPIVSPIAGVVGKIATALGRVL